MNAKEFNAVNDVFRKKIENLENEIQNLKNERKEFREEYIHDVFKASGHKIGDKITDEDGHIWFVAGARESRGNVYLNLNMPKKDGTMSKVTFIARGEPRIRIDKD